MGTKDPHPGAKKNSCERFDAPSLLLQPAEITTVTPRVVPRFLTLTPRNPIGKPAVCILTGSVGSERQSASDVQDSNTTTSIFQPWRKITRRPFTIGGGVKYHPIQSITTLLSPTCRPIPALGKRLQARPFAHHRKRRSGISVQSYKPPHATNMTLHIYRFFKQALRSWLTRASPLSTTLESHCT